MKVCKFGGSSLADAAQLNKVIDIVLADPARRIVVVSAPGKRDSKDTKVTDLLIALAKAALNGEQTDAPLKAVVDRYAGIAADLKLGDEIVKKIEDDLRGRLASVPAPATRDEIGFDELGDLVAELQLRRHLRIPRDDLGERRLALRTPHSALRTPKRRLRERDQEVGHLRVVLVTLARRRNNHQPPRGIREDDVDRLVELRRVRKRRSAEFADFHLRSPI